MPTLHIQLLGEFGLIYGNRSPVQIKSRRLQSILAYMLLHRNAVQSRQHLSYLFWPDSSEGQALTNLRKHLHLLRRVLPEAERFVFADNLTAGWRVDAPYILDVQTFEEAITNADRADRQGDKDMLLVHLQHAADAYQGDLLKELYDDWVLTERDRLHGQFTQVMERLVVLLEECREYPAAESQARRWLRHDPLNETAYRYLMQLYAMNGERAKALRTYHTCLSVLEREIGVKPSRATEEVYQRLLGEEIDHRPRREVSAWSGPMIGRQDEWSRIRKSWKKARDLGPQFLIISGEAGTGKTRLAEEHLEWAAKQGIPSAIARCYETGTGLAFAPLVSWLRAEKLKSSWSSLQPVWLRELSSLLPEVMSEAPTLPSHSDYNERWGRQRLFDALVRAILACRQAVLVLDDIQWCDPETLEWLGYLFSASQNLPDERLKKGQILILATIRAGEVGRRPELQALLKHLQTAGERISYLETGLLSEEETISLAETIAGQSLTPEYLTRLYRETVGNPLFIVETIRAGFTGKLPHRVQQVLISRLAQLMPDTRRIVEITAVIGREFTYDLIARVSQEDETLIINALDELWHRRIIQEQGDRGYEFTHPLICTTALDQLSPVKRSFIHRKIGKALEEILVEGVTRAETQTAPLSSLPEENLYAQIARHYEAAGMLEKTVTYYRQAAETAMQIYAVRQAIDHYQDGLTALQNQTTNAHSVPQLAREQRRLLEGLGKALALSGEHNRAREAFLKALEQLPDEESIQRASLYRQVGDTYKSLGEYSQAVKEYERAESALKRAPEDGSLEAYRQWLQVQFSRIFMLYGMGEVGQMLALGEKIGEDIERLGTSAQQAEFYLAKGVMLCRRDRYRTSDQTLETTRKALEAYNRVGDLNGITEAQFATGFASLWHGDLGMAEGHLLACLETTQQIGKETLAVLCLAYLSTISRLRGDLERCKEYCQACLEKAKGLELPTYSGLAQANLAWYMWKTGERSLAWDLAHAALDNWQGSVFPFQWTAYFLLMALSLEKGEVSKSIQAARALVEPIQQKQPEAVEDLIASTLADWDRGNRDRVQETLTQLVALVNQ
jgi:DNA-binding SARP family transcriptional activator